MKMTIVEPKAVNLDPTVEEVYKKNPDAVCVVTKGWEDRISVGELIISNSSTYVRTFTTDQVPFISFAHGSALGKNVRVRELPKGTKITFEV